MSGRPKLKAFSKRVDAAGGEDYLFERVAGGETIAVIMGDFGVSRGMFYLWLKAGDDTRRAKYDAARKLSADALAERGLEILDSLGDHEEISTAEVSAASARANYRKWLASIRDRDGFGDQQKGLNVNLNIGSLHLDALRHAGHMAIPAADYELVESEEGAHQLEGTGLEEDSGQ